MNIKFAPIEIYPALQLRLPSCLVIALRNLAAREGLSLSAVVTALVIEGLRVRSRRRQ
jgi:hypothetical protein